VIARRNIGLRHWLKRILCFAAPGFPMQQDINNEQASPLLAQLFNISGNYP
jgi:hypothetical protein